MPVIQSASGFAETHRRLLDSIEQRGLTVFAEVDHAAGAREVGLELPAEEVVLFGSPRTGTPLMQADPRIGIELPLRILVWEGSDGAQVGYNDPLELAERYQVSEHRATLEAMSQLLAGLAGEATK